MKKLIKLNIQTKIFTKYLLIVHFIRTNLIVHHYKGNIVKLRR